MRQFDLGCALNVDAKADIALDASPQGLAGILSANGRPVDLFSEALAHLDASAFERELGRPEGQQARASLAALVAIRVRRKPRQKCRGQLVARGGSVATLTLVVNMCPRSWPLHLAAQELTIELANYRIMPAITHHIPGVANRTADALFRRHLLGAAREQFPFLQDAVEVRAPTRDGSDCCTRECVPEVVG